MLEVPLLDYLLLGIASIGVVGLLTPLMRKLAIKTEIVDRPNSSHKSHSTPVPYLGGVAIMAGVWIVVSFAVLYKGTELQFELALSILIPAALLGIVGLFDDKYALAPLPRFIAQSAVATLTSFLVISSNSLGTPTGNVFFDGLLSIFWIVGVTNSINFFDNIDGGASGTVSIISLSVFAASVLNEQILLAAISMVLAGSSLGFLIWNKSPARIYMGDAGALFLGFILSVLTIRLDPDVDHISLSFLVPFLILAIPILDTSVAVISRLRRRVSPFQGGRDHLSHRLMRKGFAKEKAVMVLWALSGVFCTIGFLIAIGNSAQLVLATGAVLLWLLLLRIFLKAPDTELTNQGDR